MTKTFPGTFFSLWIMSSKLKMNDSMISIIASVFDTAVAVSFLLVIEEWQLNLSKSDSNTFLFFNTLSR